MADDGHYRKIALQSPEDLHYLVANVRRAAADRLDLDLPRAGDADGEDEYRARVEQLVYEYIHTTFNLVVQNITVNGLPPSASPSIAHLLPSSTSADAAPPAGPVVREVEVFEPVDAHLLERARALYRQEEDLRVEIAALRRAAPQEVAARYAAAFAGATATDDEDARRAPQVPASAALPLDVGPLPRQDDVAADWTRGVQMLARLKADMPATAAKMQRAKVAAEFATKDE